jgi:hypothetical protein
MFIILESNVNVAEKRISVLEDGHGFMQSELLKKNHVHSAVFLLFGAVLLRQRECLDLPSSSPSSLLLPWFPHPPLVPSSPGSCSRQYSSQQPFPPWTPHITIQRHASLKSEMRLLPDPLNFEYFLNGPRRRESGPAVIPNELQIEMYSKDQIYLWNVCSI